MNTWWIRCHNHQITWVSTFHSHSDTLNCFFSFTIVQGFPNLDLLGAGQQWQQQWVCAAWAQVCPHCALETPAPGRELRCSLAEPRQLSWPQAASRSYSAKEGKVSVPAGSLWVQEGLFAQVSKEVSSPGAPGSVGWGRWWPSGSLVWVHPPKHHTDRELTSLPLCVCCCSSAPLPSHSRCLEPSPLCKGKSSSCLYAGQEEVSGEVLGTECGVHCPDIHSLFSPGQQRIRNCHRHVLGREQHVYRI